MTNIIEQIYFPVLLLIVIIILLGLRKFFKINAYEKPKKRIQVSFGAMLEAKSYATLNRFLKKRADYVICDKKLNILLILELDGWSHKGKEKEDAARDKLLTDAGYKVLHLKKIPELEEMKKIFNTYNIHCSAIN